MPDWLQPMAATLTQDRFVGSEWLFERKFDGVRLLAYKRGSEVQLYSRNRLPQNLPPVAAAVRQLPAGELILDWLAIAIRESPFTKAAGLPRLRSHRVRPRIVVLVGFIEWTVHGKLRHPRLLGVRADKDPHGVTREQP